jgi:hypothetical protein
VTTEEFITLGRTIITSADNAARLSGAVIKLE